VIGQRLGAYEVLSKLGEGGMGVVWKARDTRLDRIVAIKTSRTEFSERFAAEARAVAALNHPNICQLYDVGKLPDEGSYLVMEFIDGAPIAPVESPRKLLDLVVQLADGLAAAHAAGFTHRDLKPDNVLVTGPQSPHPGRVKILDFGLVTHARVNPASDVTQTAGGLTDPGTVLGTVSYMSPEQARGEQVDARSDQFSFGLIVYELASGRRAFALASTAETMAAIIRDDPTPLPASVPAPLRWVVERCLAKAPEERYDSTRDLYRELKFAGQRLSDAIGVPAAAAPVRRGSRFRTWGTAVLGGIVIAVATFGITRWWSPVPVSPAWAGVMLGGSEMAFEPRLSPDGHLLAFQAVVDGITQVAVMTPESGDWSVLTRDRSQGPVFNLSWSRDGTRIFYDRYTDVARRIFSVPVLGGDERLVLEGALNPEPLPDGSLLISRQNADERFQMHRFWPGTGRLQALPLVTRSGNLNLKTRVLPDGTAAVAVGEPVGQTAAAPGFYLIDLASGATRLVNSELVGEGDFAIDPDGTSMVTVAFGGAVSRIVRIPLNSTGNPTPLLTVTSQVWYLDASVDGVYASLVDRPVDVVRFADDGTRVERLASFQQIPDFTTMAVLPDGRGVVPERASSRIRLMLVQPGKDPAPLVNSTEETAAPVTACGAREVALMIGPEPRDTIGFADPTSNRLIRTLTPGKGPVDSLSCSPDGQTVYFSARGVIWSMPAIGLSADSEPRQIRTGSDVVADPSGRRLIVQVLERSQLRRFSVPLDGEPEREIPPDPSASFSDLPLSPGALDADGRLLTPLLPLDSWFNPPAIVDTRTGRITRIPSDNLHDYQSIGWTPDGEVMALKIGLRAVLWKFQTTTR